MKKSYEACQQNVADFVEEAEKTYSDALRSAVNGNSSVRVKHTMLANTVLNHLSGSLLQPLNNSNLFLFYNYIFLSMLPFFQITPLTYLNS